MAPQIFISARGYFRAVVGQHSYLDIKKMTVWTYLHRALSIHRWVLQSSRSWTTPKRCGGRPRFLRKLSLRSGSARGALSSYLITLWNGGNTNGSVPCWSNVTSRYNLTIYMVYYTHIYNKTNQLNLICLYASLSYTSLRLEQGGATQNQLGP